jgi:hypothetical protein
MQLTELNALRAYARVLNTLSPEALAALESLLAQDFVYESQMVLTPLRSKREFRDYIVLKMKTIESTGATVFAEMGQVRAYGGLQPCVVVAQGGKDDLVGVVVATVTGNKLSRLDLCVVPEPHTAMRSGQYPR